MSSQRVNINRMKRRDEDDDDEDEDEVEELPDTAEIIEAMREARVDKKKTAEEDDEDEEEDAPRGLLAGMAVNNPNAQNKHNKQVKLKNINDMGDLDPQEGLTRREREALEAERKRAEYQRLHLAGKTDQAKEEMRRLAEVRARREAAARQRGEEPAPAPKPTAPDSDEDSSDDDTPPPAKATSAPKTLAEKKREAALGLVEEPAEMPKLKAMDIKKMSGDALKQALRERGLDIQGPKKDLIKRLCDYEAARA